MSLYMGNGVGATKYEFYQEDVNWCGSMTSETAGPLIVVSICSFFGTMSTACSTIAIPSWECLGYDYMAYMDNMDLAVRCPQKGR